MTWFGGVLGRLLEGVRWRTSGAAAARNWLPAGRGRAATPLPESASSVPSVRCSCADPLPAHPDRGQAPVTRSSPGKPWTVLHAADLRPFRHARFIFFSKAVNLGCRRSDVNKKEPLTPNTAP